MSAGRRGSGFSVSLNKPNETSPAAPTSPYQHHMVYHNMMPTQPPVAPYYIQAPQYPINPIMMSPAENPGFSYGSPMISGPAYGGNLRRAGSINAKIFSQDAQRPFSNVNSHLKQGRHGQQYDMDEYAGVTRPMIEPGTN